MDRQRKFDALVTPCLPAAYNLARWLTGNAADADDVVQEACLRAFRFLDDYRGGDARAWLLRIVRNAALTWLRERRDARREVVDSDYLAIVEEGATGAARGEDVSRDPADLVAADSDARWIARAIEKLPDEQRETLVLREIEGLSYREIAMITGAPLGTVMSRLSRARDHLAGLLRESQGVVS